MTSVRSWVTRVAMELKTQRMGDGEDVREDSSSEETWQRCT